MQYSANCLLLMIILITETLQPYSPNDSMAQNDSDKQLQREMFRMQTEDAESCQFASAVLKASETGFTSNKRLLVIKGGHLYYYSNIPKFFNGDSRSLEYFHELPKGSIDIIRIKRLNTFEANSPQFTIFFDAMFAMQREDIHKSITNADFVFTPRDVKGETNWHFVCENAFIKQKWISILLFLTKYYINEERKVEKYFQNLNMGKSERAQELAASLTRRKTVRNPWRESTARQRGGENRGKRMTEFKIKLEGEMPELSFKKSVTEVERPISNSYSSNTDMQSFEMSYQPPKPSIEQMFPSSGSLSQFSKNKKY